MTRLASKVFAVAFVLTGLVIAYCVFFQPQNWKYTEKCEAGEVVRTYVTGLTEQMYHPCVQDGE